MENIELARKITQLLNNTEVAEAHKNTFLSQLSIGQISTDEWKTFLIERFIIAEGFVGLLGRGIELSQRDGLVEVEQALVQNLQDETGVTEDGLFDESLAHSTWRQDFLRALSLNDSASQNSASSPGVRVYSETVQSLLKQEKTFVVIGAILFLESHIPHEFLHIQKGMEISFPDVFRLNDQDSEENRQYKKQARQYIDDHILHDASAHYPDLLRAVTDSIRGVEDLQDLTRGINIIAKAKIDFYISRD